jgi:hypothetical protein
LVIDVSCLTASPGAKRAPGLVEWN